jgi:hypothetical protein
MSRNSSDQSAAPYCMMPTARCSSSIATICEIGEY